MSDIKLFSLAGGDVRELHGEAAALGPEGELLAHAGRGLRSY